MYRLFSYFKQIYGLTMRAVCMQEVLVKEQPLEYNKEDLLNPCFVVFGKRRQ